MRKLFTLAVVSGLFFHSAAQDSVRNTGNLQIHTGASLTGFGVFQNAAGSQLVNAGSIYLRNHLVNDEASMSAGTGTLILNGSVLQQINGAQPFLTFNLTTNNAAGILLNNDLSVSGTHTFNSGMITVSATPNYLIYEDGSGYSGDSDTKHVNGWVKKNGTGDFSFPVGDGVYERKTALSSLSASSSFTCHYYKPTSNIYNLMSPLVQVKENEYWQINKISGGTARITLNWDHSRVPMNHVLISEILVAYFTGGQWTSLGGTASGNVLTTGSVTSNAVSNFGTHTMGYTNFPLPLQLISFSAVRDNDVSILDWVTAHESSVSHFVIQRSFNGIDYIDVGQVSARNSGSTESYRFHNPVEYSGKAYYRLKITDIGGKSGYSSIVVLNESKDATSFFTLVNPVHNEIRILGTAGARGTYQYRIYNLAGATIQNGTVTLAGSSSVIVPMRQYIAPGIYEIELKNQTGSQARKLLIQ